jgi:hypothetical protein
LNISQTSLLKGVPHHRYIADGKTITLIQFLNIRVCFGYCAPERKTIAILMPVIRNVLYSIMANQKIFFSYSRIDGSASALRLATDLKKRGYDVWIDQEDIRAGKEWDAEIEKGLETCDCLLFLATEKSVASTNVLDEVYYALEQHKKVIPLIFVNSKIPFRLNRLQHIDFTKDYDTALALLVNELEGTIPDITYTNEEKAPAAAEDKPFLAKNYMALVILGCLAVLIGAVIVLSRKGESIGPAEVKSGGALADTATGDMGKLTGMPVNIGDVSGNWSLADVEPKARSHRGYLQIEASGESKASIKGYMQFYYPDSKALASPVVFNGFVGCSSCVLSKEMKLKVEDISVSSRTIKRAHEDQTDGKKAGDTISDAGATRSMYGTAVLQFVDKGKAVIRVTQTKSVELTDELKLEPFVYTFYFKKQE